MDGSAFALLEGIGITVLVLGAAIWNLVSTRREIKRVREAEEKAAGEAGTQPPA